MNSSDRKKRAGDIVINVLWDYFAHQFERNTRIAGNFHSDLSRALRKMEAPEYKELAVVYDPQCSGLFDVYVLLKDSGKEVKVYFARGLKTELAAV